ncbi:hypothetical protein BT96DRAFT_1015181 [Gymnopus androsaceus JB14]|uniref:Uncharacterized protein n=1 Tax=Gymnopus androsaceus JB14 TaxID=1447944 RepID=A0A6A4IB08_9AGAR|nr:hypothetical protein BT96DRAFT_1015181 [Gymnopus androsaceus JB14]
MIMAQYLQSRIQDPIWLEPHEISFLRTRISEEEALVQTFEIRMDEFRAQISELTLQKDAKLVEIASLRNVLAPVRRVPLEILTEIFELVSEYRLWSIVSHMFIISSVCVAWRKAAHAAPRLWSTLCIDMEAHILSSDYTWVNDWFTRSQIVPLNLHLDFCMDEYDESLIQRGKKFLEYILTQLGHKVRLLHVRGHPVIFSPHPSSVALLFTALIGRIISFDLRK